MIRWIIRLIGVLAVLLLIWLGGPMLALGETKPLDTVYSRFIATILFVLVWGANILWKKFKSSQINAQLIANLIRPPKAEAEPENLAASEDVSAIRNNFSNALSVLKKTTFRGNEGAQHLYELPWYIIIGPPGAGKTTALLNSGLRFPLRDQFGDHGMRGFGGTRGCDWWFSDEAVLIDTAGRYTTQDSDAEVDSAGWGGFLDLLKKHRKRRPINGVIVAISLSDLMSRGTEDRRLHANAIKRRILELQKRLAIKFPIYVLFTKSDMIAGFTEFFDDLGQEERSQVWGMSFSLSENNNPQGVVSRFDSEFDVLLERINQRLVPRLYQERDLSRRAAIQKFPYQLASLKSAANQFLQEVFRPSQFEDTSILRGVYFTSGTQEGTPIDRVMGSLASSFGLDRQSVPSFSGQGRSYFLTNLFKRVIFPESGVGGTNRRVERQRNILQLATYVVSITLIITVTAIWTIGYSRNLSNLEIIQAHFTEYERQKQKLYPDSLLQQALPALNTLRAATLVYHYEGIGPAAGLGLSKEGSIEASSMAAYHRALRTDFLPRLGQRLEIQLRQPDAPADFLQGVLKVYLMLSDITHLDPNLVKSWMEQDWKNTFADNPTRQHELMQHLTALFGEEFQPITTNEPLVIRTRHALSQVPLAERVYARIKQESTAHREFNISLKDIIGLSNPVVFTSRSNQDFGEIPALFTYKGYHNFYRKEAMRFAKESVEETWVMGEQQRTTPIATNPDLLNEQVQKLYLNEYLQYWNKKLSDLSIVKFTSINHGIEVLEQIISPQSPLNKLLATIADNTELNRSILSSPTAVGAIESVTNKAKYLAQAVMAADEQTSSLLSEDLGIQVQKNFDPMIKLVAQKGDAPAPVESILTEIAELHAYLTELSGGDSSASLQAAMVRMNDGSKDAIGKLRARSIRLPEPMKIWVEEITQSAWRVVLNRARDQVNTVWRLDVLPEYEQNLKNRYPLYKTSTQDVTIADFGHFFGEGGTIDTYFKNYLSPFVNTRRNDWALRPLEGLSLPMSNQALDLFQQARMIREMYFTGGGKQPLLPFSLRAVDLDRNISRFSLDVDGQHIVYRHGPTRWQKLQWPGPDGTNQSRISFEASSGSMQSQSTDGQWSWFRLLDQSNLQRTAQADLMKVLFHINNLSAKYELRGNSINNPFLLQSLSKFRAPGSL